MDEVVDLIYQANDAGVYLWVSEEGSLKYGTQSTFPAILRAELREYKREVVSILAASGITGPGITLADAESASMIAAAQELFSPWKVSAWKSFRRGLKGTGAESEAGAQFVNDRHAKIIKVGTKKVARAKHFRVLHLAHEWISMHIEELLQVGWTRTGLYRRNKSLGVAMMDNVWEQPNLQVSLTEEGCIRFQYVNQAGANIVQTAWPRGRYRKLGKGERGRGG